MCGIAGYSLNSNSDLDRTFTAQALLAGIAERGADAVGYAYRSQRQRRGAQAALRCERAPRPRQRRRRRHPGARPRARLHEGPSRRSSPTTTPCATAASSGSTTGSSRTTRRSSPGTASSAPQPDMTVDSAAIFALAERADSRAEALEELRGSMATAWMDERRADVLFLARGVGRPLWVGRGEHEVLFASTEATLQARRALLRARAGARGDPGGHAARPGPRSRGLAGAVPPDHRRTRRRRFPRCGLLARAPPASSASPRSPPRSSSSRRRPVLRDARRPARAGARGSGTGTSTRLRAWRRTCDRPATRSAASESDASCLRPSRRTSAAGRARAPAPLPGRRRARAAPPPPARRSRPRASAFVSEPKVCQ